MNNNYQKINGSQIVKQHEKNNLLFYSRKCNTCVNLLNIMKNENLINYFELICVDNTIIPKDITIVPTMIVTSIAKPLVAKDIFDWINQIKYINKKKQDENGSTGPFGYNSQEMSSLSDFYAYTDLDKPMEQSYISCDGKIDAIPTIPETNIKINKNAHKYQADELIMLRKEQENELKKIIKENQEMIKKQSGL